MANPLLSQPTVAIGPAGLGVSQLPRVAEQTTGLNIQSLQDAKLDFALFPVAASGGVAGDLLTFDGAHWINRKWISGPLGIGAANVTGQQLSIYPLTATDLGLVLQGLTGQLGDLLRLQSATAGLYLTMSGSGDFGLGANPMPATFGDGQFGATVPALPNFFVSNRGNAAGPTNYHPGVSGSIIPRWLVSDPPLAFWFSANPGYHSGGRGLTLDKLDATDPLPHAFSFAVSGDLKWGYGMDAGTNLNGGNADYVPIFDYKARGGLGADMLRGCPSDSTAWGTNLWGWGAAGYGTPRANSYFLTLQSSAVGLGCGLGGLDISTSGGVGLRVNTQSSAAAAIFQGNVNTGGLTAGAATLSAVTVTGAAQLLGASSLGALVAGATTLSTLAVTGSAGFYNTAPQPKPAVSGNVANPTALTSLVQSLATLGLVTNNTTATDPTAPAWTWVNQGSATVTNGNAAVFLNSPAAGADSLKLRVIPVPASPYTLTMGFQPLLPYANFILGGLCLYNAASGSVVTLAYTNNSATLAFAPCISASKWNSPTSFNANYTTSPTAIPAVNWQAGGCVWFRIKDDATSRTYWLSNDGVNFFQILTQSNTDFLVVDHVGFFVDANNASVGAGINVLSWSAG